MCAYLVTKYFPKKQSQILRIYISKNIKLYTIYQGKTNIEHKEHSQLAISLGLYFSGFILSIIPFMHIYASHIQPPLADF